MEVLWQQKVSLEEYCSRIYLRRNNRNPILNPQGTKGLLATNSIIRIKEREGKRTTYASDGSSRKMKGVQAEQKTAPYIL